ncbi:MAG: Zn-dependent hydrolase [Candidatus Tectimicrobiota bacterium]|nr:MAG: Zn-dependent hydrolase [Candidatus Tectomicrobia bacterium]
MNAPWTVNGERLWEALMAMAQIGATPRGGVCRLALTDADREARDLFVRWAREAGCRVEVDQMGNLFARRPGKEDHLPPVLTGSHLDSQPTGGKFDGAYGVLAALEVVRTLNDLRCETRRPIEVVVWTNEEGSRFAPAMIASGVFAGEFSLDYGLSRCDRDGVSIGQELDRIGYAGPRPCGGQPVHAYFEAHIEQGPILEAEGKTIGVVLGIQGIRWVDCTLEGTAAHAGTTPLPARRDALLGAARVIQAASEVAAAHAPEARTTVGELRVHPNSRNVIPGRVDFTLDLRHPHAETLQAMSEALRAAFDRVCAEQRLAGQWQEIWYAPPTAFDPDCIAAVRRAAERLGLPHRDIISGAGHDAKYLAQVCPTAMIFIPCRDGLSHNEAEAISPADAAAGASVLLHAVLEKAQE